MTIQARFSEHDPRFYNPNRDLAHCFGEVMLRTAKAVEELPGPELTAYLKQEGVSSEDVGKGIEALCKFVLATVERPKESMPDCLERCGWFALPAAVRLAVPAVLGRVVLGMHWCGVRDATIGGTGPVATYQDLGQRGAQCAYLMAMPPWRRRLARLRAHLVGVWRALKGG